MTNRVLVGWHRSGDYPCHRSSLRTSIVCVLATYQLKQEQELQLTDSSPAIFTNSHETLRVRAWSLAAGPPTTSQLGAQHPPTSTTTASPTLRTSRSSSISSRRPSRAAVGATRRRCEPAATRSFDVHLEAARESGRLLFAPPPGGLTETGTPPNPNRPSPRCSTMPLHGPRLRGISPPRTPRRASDGAGSS